MNHLKCGSPAVQRRKGRRRMTRRKNKQVSSDIKKTFPFINMSVVSSVIVTQLPPLAQLFGPFPQMQHETRTQETQIHREEKEKKRASVSSEETPAQP
jgi:hypothetical protein